MFPALIKMLIFRLITIVLFLKGYATQKCFYDVNKFKEITCFNLTLTEQIREKTEETLQRYGSFTTLVETLKLKDCDLRKLTINSLRFLTELKRVKIRDSKIGKLTAEEITGTNGM